MKLDRSGANSRMKIAICVMPFCEAEWFKRCEKNEERKAVELGELLVEKHECK
jgi:hypothetical protein